MRWQGKLPRRLTTEEFITRARVAHGVRRRGEPGQGQAAGGTVEPVAEGVDQAGGNRYGAGDDQPVDDPSGSGGAGRV